MDATALRSIFVNPFVLQTNLCRLYFDLYQRREIMETTTTRPNAQTAAMTSHKGGSGLLERTSFADGVTKRDLKHKKAH